MNYFCAVFLLVLPLVHNHPLQNPKQIEPALEQRQAEENDSTGSSDGMLRGAFLLEELLENELMEAKFNLLKSNDLAKRSIKALIREKRGLLGNPTGATTEQEGPERTRERRNKRQLDPMDNEIPDMNGLDNENSGEGGMMTSGFDQGREIGDNDDEGGAGGSDAIGTLTNLVGSLSGGEGGDIVSTLTGLVGPLSDLSMGLSGQGSGDEDGGGGGSDINSLLNLAGPLISSSSGGEDGEDGSGGSDLGSLLGAIGPLSGSSSGGSGDGSGDGGGGSDLLGTLTGLAGPLSSSSSGGEGGGGSDITGLLTSLSGPLSASSSGGDGQMGGGGGSNVAGLVTSVAGPLSATSSMGGMQNNNNSNAGGSSNVGSLVAGVIGPLSSSSSGGGNPDGPGGFNILGTLVGLAGPLSASLSAGSNSGDGESSGGGLGGLITSILRSSSSGGGGSYDSLNGNGDNEVDTAGNSDLFGPITSLIVGISGDTDDCVDGDGSNASDLISLISSIIAGLSSGTSEGNGGNLISSLLGSSSGRGIQANGSMGTGNSSNAGSDPKVELFSALLRLKLQIFQKLLEMTTRAFASSSASTF